MMASRALRFKDRFSAVVEAGSRQGSQGLIADKDLQLSFIFSAPTSSLICAIFKSIASLLAKSAF